MEPPRNAFTRADHAAREFRCGEVFPKEEGRTVIGQPVDAFAGFLRVDADEFGVGTIARELHHVLEERFFVVFRMVLLEATPDGGHPARRIDGRSVGAAHFFKKDGLRTLFSSFQRGAHAREARTDHDDVVLFFRDFLFLRLGFGNADSAHGGPYREARLQEVSAFERHKRSPCIIESTFFFRPPNRRPFGKSASVPALFSRRRAYSGRFKATR